jgi:quercetin dioxygenase-like cupin family protein
MNRIRAAVTLVAGTLVAVAATLATAQQPQPHVAVTPRDVVWGPAPPVFRPGAQGAVLVGDPSKPGPYVVRMKAPAGFTIRPHWHPTDENVTVLSGTVAMGMGDTVDATGATQLVAGSYMLVPAESHHFMVARTEAIIQVHGVGPFAITYVNPADDPRNDAKKP